MKSKQVFYKRDFGVYSEIIKYENGICISIEYESHEHTYEKSNNVNMRFRVDVTIPTINDERIIPYKSSETLSICKCKLNALWGEYKDNKIDYMDNKPYREATTYYYGNDLDNILGKIKNQFNLIMADIESYRDDNPSNEDLWDIRMFPCLKSRHTIIRDQTQNTASSNRKYYKCTLKYDYGILGIIEYVYKCEDAYGFNYQLLIPCCFESESFQLPNIYDTHNDIQLMGEYLNILWGRQYTVNGRKYRMREGYISNDNAKLVSKLLQEMVELLDIEMDYIIDLVETNQPFALVYKPYHDYVCKNEATIKYKHDVSVDITIKYHPENLCKYECRVSINLPCNNENNDLRRDMYKYTEKLFGTHIHKHWGRHSAMLKQKDIFVDFYGNSPLSVLMQANQQIYYEVTPFIDALNN